MSKEENTNVHIKNEGNSTFILRWKLFGSIVGFMLVVVALFTKIMYLPSKDGFLYYEKDPNIFIGITIFLFILSCVSFVQGYKGLKNKKNA